MTCKVMSGTTAGLTCSVRNTTMCHMTFCQKLLHVEYRQAMWKLLLKSLELMTLQASVCTTVYGLLPAAALCSLPPYNLV